MGPNEAVLPTMVPDGCGAAWEAAAAPCARKVLGAAASCEWPAKIKRAAKVRVRVILEGGLAAVRRGVASSDDLRPSV